MSHRKNLAERQGDEIRAGGGAAGEDPGQGIGRIASGVYAQGAAFVRRVVPVEPVQHEDMGVALQPQEAVAIRVKDSQVRGFTVSLDLTYRVYAEVSSPRTL